MLTKDKGQALVLNISNFHEQPGMKRTGSEVDVINATHLLEQIGYRVVIHKDLTAQVCKITSILITNCNEQL